MAKDPVDFTLANQILEISSEEVGPHVTVIATGRSDYSNQINNILCFPGFFKLLWIVWSHILMRK